MKSFQTEIQNHAKKTRLLVSEKRALRERIHAYMEYHPLRSAESALVESEENFVPSPMYVFHFKALHMRVLGALCLILVLGGQFMATRAVPGDVLYLVKTGVLEPIEGKLAGTSYEKIEFETKLMERRIAEARVLAREGKLTEEVESQIAETVKQHTNAVQDELAVLRAEDATGATFAEITFHASLEVQSAVLDATEDTASTSNVSAILVVVNDVRTEVGEGVIDETVTFESLMAQIETDTTRAYELIQSIRQSAEDPESYDIDRRMEDINRLITEAEAIREYDVPLASKNLHATLSQLQKLIAFLSDIEVRQTVAIDTLVPVVLSSEEESVARQAFVIKITNFLSNIASETPAYSPLVQEKIQTGVTVIEDALDAYSLIPPETDMSSIHEYEESIWVYVRDIESILATNKSDTDVRMEEELPVQTEATSTPDVSTPAEEDLAV